MLSKISLIIISSYIFVSCSGLVESTRKSLLGDDSPRKKATKEAKWVSKDQYDDLMDKYKILSGKYEKIKEDKYSGGTSGVDHVGEMTEDSTSAETVDVFGKNGIANKKAAPIKMSNVSLEEELDYFKKAVALKENNKNDEALKIFQFLEKSTSKQIQVRSKAYIGDIYLLQNQYDLALQVYENIINVNAFSGAVINALKNAAICAGKLGLTDKQAQYQSLVRDVFELQG